MDVLKELEKHGLTPEDYEKALSIIADKKDGIKDLDWSDICQMFSLTLNKDSIRKMNDGIFGGYFVKKYQEYKNIKSFSEEELIQEIEEKKKELALEKIRVQDEKRINSKYMRAYARHDRMVETIRQEMSKFKPLEYEIVVKENNFSKQASLLISDLHYGIAVDNYWNFYNTKIAQERMLKLVEDVIHYCEKHEVHTLHIELLGDLLSGYIHKTLELENEVNMVQQVIGCAELLSVCINELANKIEKVNVYMTLGNHGRMNPNKKESVDAENFEYLVWEFIKMRCVRDDVRYFENDIDETFICYEVDGEKVFGTHGHYDKVNSIAQNFATMFNGTKIKAIHCGHLHHEYTNCINNIKVIMNSTASGVDTYSKNMRYVGNPSQTLLIYDGKNTINVNIEL